MGAPPGQLGVAECEPLAWDLWAWCCSACGVMPCGIVAGDVRQVVVVLYGIVWLQQGVCHTSA